MTKYEQQKIDAAFLAWSAEVGNVIYAATAEEIERSKLPQYDDPGSDVHDHLPLP